MNEYLLVCKEKLGMVSGELINEEDGKKVYSKYPWASSLVYSRKCFDDIGGLKATISHDSIERIIAKEGGWSYQKISDVAFNHLRDMGSRKNLYEGFKRRGMAAKWLGSTLPFAILKFFWFILTKYPAAGLGFIVGFLQVRKKYSDKRVLEKYGKKLYSLINTNY